MTDWRHEWRKCHCGETFRPKREAQRFCSELCRDADKKHRKRSGDKTATPARIPRSGDMPATELPTGFWDGPTLVWPERDFHHGPTPGALQGDDYPLEYYEDGYPKLPACLDRRSMPEPLADAA